MRHDGGQIMRAAAAQKARQTAWRQQLRDLMQHNLGHGQRALTHLHTQQQLHFGIDRRPHPLGQTGETLDGLGFAESAIPGGADNGVEFVDRRQALSPGWPLARMLPRPSHPR
jgi:hypothetical protein